MASPRTKSLCEVIDPMLMQWTGTEIVKDDKVRMLVCCKPRVYSKCDNNKRKLLTDNS